MARPFIPVPDVAVFDILQELDGVPYCNSFHWWIFGDVWNATTMADMANGLEYWFTGRMLPLLGDDVIYTGIKGRDLTTETGATYELVATPQNGSFGAPSLPLNDAIYMMTRTSLLGPRHSFYNVISGIPNTQVVGNLVNQTYLTSLYNQYIWFQDAPTTIDASAVNVSYITGGNYRSEGAFYGIGHTHRPKRKIGNRSKRLRNWMAP